MVDVRELLVVVDAAYVRVRAGLSEWLDPHLGGSPSDDEYSRLLDPGKWRIIGARADAWLEAVAHTEIATLNRDPPDWRHAPPQVLTSITRAVPVAMGALPLVIGRSQLSGVDDVVVDDAGVVLGVGHRAECLAWFPHCGCDACDSGSQDEIDRLDHYITSVVTGRFRRLEDGERSIVFLGDAEWSSTGDVSAREVDRLRRDPEHWNQLTGASWLTAR